MTGSRSDTERAVDIAVTVATHLGLTVEDAVVLNDSNRLVVRLVPCDVVVRVTRRTHDIAVHGASAEREVEVVRLLGRTDSPVAPLDPRVGPRVFVRDDFEVTVWTPFEAGDPRALEPAEYANALQRLHVGLRQVTLDAPHVMDRVAATQRDVASRRITPDLAEGDRALLAERLRHLARVIVDSRAPEQLLHGEPHPWNVLNSHEGPLFIDFENTSRGPVEYDLAWVPEEVSELYPDVDEDLIGECRGLVLAIVAMHRWRRGDQHPSGRESGVAFLNALRNGPPWPSLDRITW